MCGETGDVLALRARAAALIWSGDRQVHPWCAAAIPAAVRDTKNLWVRVDSAGYRHDVFNVCEQLDAVFSITAPQRSERLQLRCAHWPRIPRPGGCRH
ncbi:MAG: hypothetical protein R2697_11290 [Ilumatobacteraceae bacterium]